MLSKSSCVTLNVHYAYALHLASFKILFELEEGE